MSLVLVLRVIVVPRGQRFVEVWQLFEDPANLLDLRRRGDAFLAESALVIDVIERLGDLVERTADVRDPLDDLLLSPLSEKLGDLLTA